MGQLRKGTVIKHKQPYVKNNGTIVGDHNQRYHVGSREYIDRSDEIRDRLSIRLGSDPDFLDRETRYRIRIGKREYLEDLKKNKDLTAKDAKKVNKMIEGSIVSTAAETFEIAEEDITDTRHKIEDFQEELVPRTSKLFRGINQIDEAAKIVKQRGKKIPTKREKEIKEMLPYMQKERTKKQLRQELKKIQKEPHAMEKISKTEALERLDVDPEQFKELKRQGKEYRKIHEI